MARQQHSRHHESKIWHAVCHSAPWPPEGMKAFSSRRDRWAPCRQGGGGRRQGRVGYVRHVAAAGRASLALFDCLSRWIASGRQVQDHRHRRAMRDFPALDALGRAATCFKFRSTHQLAAAVALGRHRVGGSKWARCAEAG